MRSPLERQSILLSSSTVFMFSIHSASTGPSKMTQLKLSDSSLTRHAHERRHEAVGPLLRHHVDLAVELAHRDALRVERVCA